MSHKERLKEWAVTIALLVVFFAIRSSLINHYHVPSGSMLATIQLGDHIFTNRVAFDLKFPFTGWQLATLGEPERGDVIVFDFPKDESQTYVKRLIGLPGDLITLQDGHVLINGKPEEEVIGKSYVHTPAFPLNETSEWRVPEGHYLMLGDNRSHSADSRDWGFVERRQILGRAVYRLWNFRLGEFPFLTFTGFGDKF